MTDFTQARKNMVDCQIHPFGVIDERILKAFSETPREMFVSTPKKSVAYNDEDLRIDDQTDRYILEPCVHAKMVQYLDLQSDDVVLDLAASTGYSAAILSTMASTIVSVEENEEFCQIAAKNLQALGVFNVAVNNAKLAGGAPENAPYDKIFINGAITEVPHAILSQLASHGLLIAIIKAPGEVMGHVTLFQRNSSDGFSQTPLFSSGAAYLPGFEPESAFAL